MPKATPPNTPFSTPLSSSAKEAEARIRNLFSAKRGRPPLLILVLACALALLSQLFAVQLETVAGDLETALVQASGAAIAGRILFVITLIFETMAVVSHHFAARDRT